MASKVVEADAGVHTLSMAVAVSFVSAPLFLGTYHRFLRAVYSL